MSTSRAFTCCALKMSDLQDGLAPLERHPLHEVHELVERQIAYLASPQPLHTVDVQVFKAEYIVGIAQGMCQFELGIAAFVRHANMRPTDQSGGFLAVVRAVRFLVLARLQHAQTPQSVEMMQARDVFFSRVIGQEGFQTKIEARDFTRRDSLRNKHFLNHTEKQPQSPGSIPFHGHCLDRAVYLTMLDVLVGSSADLDFVAVEQFPAHLFERERLALADFLILGRTLCQVLEKALVAAVESFEYVLDGLRTHLHPKGVPSGFAAQFGDMRFQLTERDVFSRQGVVAFLERKRMIPDRTSNVDLFAQKLIALVAAIESVLVGSVNSAKIAHTFDAPTSGVGWGCFRALNLPHYTSIHEKNKDKTCAFIQALKRKVFPRRNAINSKISPSFRGTKGRRLC